MRQEEVVRRAFPSRAPSRGARGRSYARQTLSPAHQARDLLKSILGVWGGQEEVHEAHAGTVPVWGLKPGMSRMSRYGSMIPPGA